MVLHRWESETWNFGFIQWVDKGWITTEKEWESWQLECSDLDRANKSICSYEVSAFQIFHGGSLTLSTKLIIVITLLKCQVLFNINTNWGHCKLNLIQIKVNQMQVLRRGENQSTWGKASQSREENQQTQPKKLWVWKWNPGHIGGRRVLSPLHHHCSPNKKQIFFLCIGWMTTWHKVWNYLFYKAANWWLKSSFWLPKSKFWLLKISSIQPKKKKWNMVRHLFGKWLKILSLMTFSEHHMAM